MTIAILSDKGKCFINRLLIRIRHCRPQRGSQIGWPSLSIIPRPACYLFLTNQLIEFEGLEYRIKSVRCVLTEDSFKYVVLGSYWSHARKNNSNHLARNRIDIFAWSVVPFHGFCRRFIEKRCTLSEWNRYQSFKQNGISSLDFDLRFRSFSVQFITWSITNYILLIE